MAVSFLLIIYGSSTRQDKEHKTVIDKKEIAGFLVSVQISPAYVVSNICCPRSSTTNNITFVKLNCEFCIFPTNYVNSYTNDLTDYVIQGT